MTAAVLAPTKAKMPGYNNINLDEVHSLARIKVDTPIQTFLSILKQYGTGQKTNKYISDNSFAQHPSTFAPSTSFFAFAPTDSSNELVNGSWIAPGDALQYFAQFPENGIQHTGEPEDYAFASGQTTPRGSRINHGQTIPDSSWAAPAPLATATRSQTMVRVHSGQSSCSSLSHGSSSMGVVSSNGSGFDSFVPPALTGRHIPSVVGVTSPLTWPGYDEDALSGDFHVNGADLGSLHIAPAQVTLEQAILHENSSPGSLDDFESSISRTSSPTTVDEAWMNAAFTVNSPSDLICETPKSDVRLMEEKHCKASLTDSAAGINDFIEDGELDSPREDAYYKNASRGEDGLFHCPWEGKPGCNHKPEKLKCNFDKYVDSHLKPYRCKIPSCEGAQFSSTACRLRHEREAHGLHGHGNKPFPCSYDGCERSLPGNGFPRLWNLRDHMKRVHNDQKAVDSLQTAPISTKGRKRKTESADGAQGNRKSLQKSAPPAEKPSDDSQPLLDRWQAHHKALQALLQNINLPGDDKCAKKLSEIEKRYQEMTKINTLLTSRAKAKSASGSG